MVSVFICSIIALTIIPIVASALEQPTFKLEKVIGNVYIGKQSAPLDPILGTGPGTYLTVNLYIIASENRNELVLIDVPGLLELFPLFKEALENEFPEAEIKAVFLTHDHLDHSWSIPYFLGTEIPVYASGDEMEADPGPYDFPIAAFDFVIPIDPGSIIPFEGGVIKAVGLKGHTPGHLGYAYFPDGDCGKINWFFAGDALLAPSNYGETTDPLDITYPFRLLVLDQDTFSYQLWIENLSSLKGRLTKNVKMFPAHGVVREGYFWKEPAAYIDYTISVLDGFIQ